MLPHAWQELPLTPDLVQPVFELMLEAPETDDAMPYLASDDHVRSDHAGEGGVPALIALIMGQLDDDQAQDALLIDLKGKSSLADAIIVASGRSQRHVAAVADHLLRALKTGGWGRARVEGLPQADWVLIDADDVIVHLFRPEVRAFYNIEKIWSVEPPHLAERTRGGFSGRSLDQDLSEPDLLDDDEDAAET